MNLANKITFTRIFIIPIFVIVLLLDFPYHQYVAAFIFVIAASTDSMDGHIARKRNEVTKLGQFLDPLADKLLTTSALVVLVEMGRISSVIAIIIIVREFIVTGFRVVAASEGVVIAASWWGKIKTLVQIISIVAILIDNFPFRIIGFPFDKVSLYIATIITIISGIDYVYKNHQVLKSSI
ncbi:MAG: CDP-diacylglycerol--glycerol-3-phosphate 3-phosphatidyltransferase [Clostridiales bacterium]|nr:CDP-diacylglycerol--glycerol-3-phosphate 3-phosphatidyltransferase [Clostridiales bacterium]